MWAQTLRVHSPWFRTGPGRNIIQAEHKHERAASHARVVVVHPCTRTLCIETYEREKCSTVDSTYRSLAVTLIVWRASALERVICRACLLPVASATGNGTRTFLCIGVTFLDFSPAFDLQPLSLCTPASTSRVVILAVLITYLTIPCQRMFPALKGADAPARHFCLDQIVDPPDNRGRGRTG